MNALEKLAKTLQLNPLTGQLVRTDLPFWFWFLQKKRKQRGGNDEKEEEEEEEEEELGMRPPW